MNLDGASNTLLSCMHIVHFPLPIRQAASKNINLRAFDDGAIGVSLDETVTANDLRDLMSIFAPDEPLSKDEFNALTAEEPKVDFGSYTRTSPYLTHKIFNTYHSETELMRYAKRLEVGARREWKKGEN